MPETKFKSPDGVYRAAKAVTPADGSDQPFVGCEIICGTGGTFKYTPAAMIDAEAITITLVAGYRYPIACKKIYATGTTASGIVVLY